MEENGNVGANTLGFGGLGFGNAEKQGTPDQNKNIFGGFQQQQTKAPFGVAQPPAPGGILKNATFTSGQPAAPASGLFGSSSSQPSTGAGGLFSSFKTPQKSGNRLI